MFREDLHGIGDLNSYTESWSLQRSLLTCPSDSAI